MCITREISSPDALVKLVSESRVVLHGSTTKLSRGGAQPEEDKTELFLHFEQDNYSQYVVGERGNSFFAPPL